MKKQLLLSTILGATLLQAASFEYPMLYKDTRFMGMGGTNIALGGESSSLFHNPAGLSGLNRSKDGAIEFELLNMTAAFSQDTFGFIGDITNDALTDAQMAAVLEDYYGKNNHLTFNNYTSFAYRGERIAWSVGILAGMQGNFQTHYPFGSAGVVETGMGVTGGLVSGISYDWDEDLHIGVGLKVLMAAGYYSEVGAANADNIQGDVEAFVNGISTSPIAAFDIGAIYDLDMLLPLGEMLRPAVGVSVSNIGGITYGDKYPTIPTTVNVGFTIQPQDVLIFSDLAFNVDYVDMFNAYETTSGLDSSFSKRLRMGGRASLFHNKFFQFTTSAGLYNAAFTGGVEMRILSLRFNYATYAEALGAYATQNLDRRHQITLALDF